ncbi:MULTISPECIES: hypothetical protein [Acetobacter]|nr:MULTISPECIES: hypothetical protein [Acetobacter]
MKKLTKKYKKWLTLRSKRSEKRRKHFYKFMDVVFYNKHGKSRRRVLRKDLFPKTLCFDRNCSETLEIFSKIRKSLASASRIYLKLKSRSVNKKISVGRYWPFDGVEYIGLSSALVLAAEYERWNILTNTFMNVVDPHKWKQSVFLCMREIGFFDIFNIPMGKTLIEDTEDFRIIKMRSGNTTAPDAVAGLITELKNLNISEVNQLDGEFVHLYGAMVEGIMNVVRHAYPQNVQTKYENVNKWWMAGAVSKSQRWMCVSIFDQGITIPTSLPAWDKYDAWKANMRQRIGLAPQANDTSFDGIAIWAAVEESVSSTGEAHRGLGLAQMRGFIDGCKSGFLRIISRNGEVTFRPASVPVACNYDHSIDGTLIEWKVEF